MIVSRYIHFVTIHYDETVKEHIIIYLSYDGVTISRVHDRSPLSILFAFAQSDPDSVSCENHKLVDIAPPLRNRFQFLYLRAFSKL